MLIPPNKVLQNPLVLHPMYDGLQLDTVEGSLDVQEDT